MLFASNQAGGLRYECL